MKRGVCILACDETIAKLWNKNIVCLFCLSVCMYVAKAMVDGSKSYDIQFLLLRFAGIACYPFMENKVDVHVFLFRD